MHETKSDDLAQGSPGEVFSTFLRLGCTSFGGPIAHLGFFRKELVERRGWVTDAQFSQLLAICQFLPGPASSQLGFSLGLIRAGWPGALAAFVAFTLPSVMLLFAFASLLPVLSDPVTQAGIQGLKLVALAVVADAVLAMSQKLCPDARRASIACLAAAAVLVADSVWMQLLVVVAGAGAGCVSRERAEATVPSIPVEIGPRLGAGLLVVCLALLLILPMLPAEGGGLVSIAEVFYRAGALVFGGGHVVLPLLEQAVVGPGWVTSETFLAGYGAAQAIPGPLFAFSAYLGAMIPTGLPAWAGALVALVFIFLPGFLLVAGVLPFWRAISGNAVANHAIAGANAAVVGLLGAALYDPVFLSAVQHPAHLAIAVIGFALLRVWGWSALFVVIWCVLANMLSY